MQSEWRKCSLEDAGVILLDCVHKTPPDAGKGIPYIAIPQLKEGRIDFSASPRLISHEHYVEWTKKANPQNNDIVLSRRCNPGETAYVPQGVKFALGQNLVLLRAAGGTIFPPFLRWLVRGTEWWDEIAKYLNVGAVFDSLRCAEIPKFELTIPPISEQKAIAHILGSLDDKIELNRQMNATLEAMAQTLFKSWFVDFDPVLDNALAVGNPIPDELQDKAAARAALGDARKPLPEDIAALFPAAFVWTEEMGWIPEGWELQPLYSIANFINGTAFKSADFTDESNALPVIKIAEVKNGISGQTKFTDKVLDDKYLIDDGAILLSWSGNPDTSIDTFIWSGGKGWLNQHIFNVVLKSECDKNFVYYQLKILRPIFAEIARDKQTTGLGHFTAGDMKKMRVIKPRNASVAVFNQHIDPIFDRWFNNLLQTRQLTALRDSLLPKLLSCELRIPDAEKRVEEIQP